MPRKCFVLILLFFTTLSVKGSNAEYTVFSHTYVSLSICHNYDYTSLGYILEYKAIAEILERYAAGLVGEGKLDSRKINIDMGGRMFGGIPSVEISRSRHAYHVTLHESPDLDRLIRLIDYIASPEWESLVYPDPDQYESARKLLDKRLDMYAPPHEISLPEEGVTVYDDGDNQIRYIEGNLVVFIDGYPVSYSPDGSVMGIGCIYPVKFKDRHIVFFEKEIHVYKIEGQSEELSGQGKNEESFPRKGTHASVVNLLKWKIPAETRYEGWKHNYFTGVYDDWMNVYYNSHRTAVFSYCYSRNRFYNIMD